MPYIDKNMKFMIEAQQKSLVYFPHDIGINPSAQRLILWEQNFIEIYFLLNCKIIENW